MADLQVQRRDGSQVAVEVQRRTQAIHKARELALIP